MLDDNLYNNYTSCLWNNEKIYFILVDLEVDIININALRKALRK